MAGISGKGPKPSYCEGMSTGSVWRVSGEQSHLLLMTMITAIVFGEHSITWVGPGGREGENMLIFFLFVCFCRNHRSCGFPQSQVNMSLVPVGVISPRQPVGLGSCSPRVDSSCKQTSRVFATLVTKTRSGPRRPWTMG